MAPEATRRTTAATRLTTHRGDEARCAGNPPCHRAAGRFPVPLHDPIGDRTEAPPVPAARPCPQGAGKRSKSGRGSRGAVADDRRRSARPVAASPAVADFRFLGDREVAIEFREPVQEIRFGVPPRFRRLVCSAHCALPVMAQYRSRVPNRSTIAVSYSLHGVYTAVGLWLSSQLLCKTHMGRLP